MGIFGRNKSNEAVPESALSSHDKTRKTASTRGDNTSGGAGGISLWTHTTNGTQESIKSRDQAVSRSRSVLMGRVVFVLILIVVAVVLGFFSFFLLQMAEQRLIDRQYDSMMARALEVTRQLATDKLQHGTMIMTQVAAYSWPNAADWPYVWIDGYWKIVEEVLPTSIYTGIHLAPIVLPEQAAEFEDFAYGKFRETFGADTDMANHSHFGSGIWVQDSSIDTVDNRYHDTTGVSIHGSPYELLVPKLQHGLVDSPYLMMNVHGFHRQGEAIDAVINCTRFERSAETTHNCQALSPFNPPKMHSQVGPFGFIASPIFPANDNNTLVGFIFGAVFWSEVMEAMFPKDTVGIDCVFHTEDEFYTYKIVNGSATYEGIGDLHNSDYDYTMRDQMLLDPTTMAAGSAQYKTTCYMNDDFVASYSDTLPLIIALAAAGIIVLVSLMFFVYDRCVADEFDAKKDLLEAKRQFVRFVSHEVRTPLNSVSMGLTLMKEEMAQSLGYKSADAMLEECDDKQAKEAEESGGGRDWFNLAHEVHTSAQSSVDVLNDLLNYDKIENGQLALELSIVPIWNLLDRTIGEFKLPMASKNIKLNFELPEMEKVVENPETLALAQGRVRDQKVIGDTVRITQVLRNLVSNAIKFTPEGGDITVRARWEKSVGGKQKKVRKYALKNRGSIARESTGTLVVTVTDTGAGMTKEQLKKLFGQGIQFNVNELQHGNGSGLGLYIAMGIVQQHEGSLTCDSEGLGRGTTFTMRVPLFDIPSQNESPGGKRRQNLHHDSSDDEIDSSYEDSKLNILIVDDANSNRKLLRRLLKLKGHETAEAENGKIAVDMVREAELANRHFDLVLMDYEMPVMIGPEAAKQIRKLGSDVFIIGVTGNLMPEDVSYFRQCGSNAVLPKPFRMNELDEIIIEHHITSHDHHHHHHFAQQRRGSGKPRSEASLPPIEPHVIFATPS
mmetsp:Transcript_1504/g.3793  ORF Transcript_1504/g.3793 Transcript_1504/m.3793 type:complete len:952 (-) Transcript_1504:216-3071(-)